MATAALARFAETLAVALRELAADLHASTSEEETVLTPEPAADFEEGRVLGKRQRQVLELTGLTEESGLKTAEIADAIQYDVPNTWMTVNALKNTGLLELIPGSKPQRWRLAPRYRVTAEPYMRLAKLVPPGRWTTYGDISIAYRGDNKAARAVGRAAATLPTFPNPHRILREGGAIPDAWHDDKGRGPEECRRRLEAEGVKFTEDGRADPAYRLTWDELLERQDSMR
jgi:alkylated DNA nucleotide flippase Atl1